MNVRDLSDQSKVDRLCDFIKFAKPYPNFFLIQEHKLISAKALELSKAINNQNFYLHIDTKLGYNNLHVEAGAGCGGTTMLINPKWEKLIGASDSLFCGQLVWIILKDLPSGDYGILNLYCPNDQIEW